MPVGSAPSTPIGPDPSGAVPESALATDSFARVVPQGDLGQPPPFQHLVLRARWLADDALEAWAQGLDRGYEGLVGKDPESPYREGRTLSWLKVKQLRYREGERGWEAKP